MRVAQAVDDADAVLLENPTSLGRSVTGDEQQRPPGMRLSLVDEAPRRGRVDLLLELDCHRRARVAVGDDGVAAPIGRLRPSLHGQAGDAPQDIQRTSFELTFYLHYFALIHSECEDSTISEESKESKRRQSSR